MAHASPIFVLGTSFSGSRLLAWALAQHPGITQALDTTWLVKLAGDLRALQRQAMPRGGSTSRLVETATTPARFHETFGAAANRLLLGTDAGVDRQPSVRRWVDCTEGHVDHISDLLGLFPQAKFIHLVRDVREVVKALVRWPPPDAAPYTEDSAYAYWLRTTRTLLDAELTWGGSTVRRVRQADLFAAPDRALRDCLDFLGEQFADDCRRPFTGLDARTVADALTSYSIATTSPVRGDAELLSDLVLGREGPDPERMASSLPPPAPETAVTSPVPPPGSLVERVCLAAGTTLPSDASVLVLSKGDDALLDLGVRRASHFPQVEGGVYAGHHPATSEEAIAHLADLRTRGYGFLLIPSPYFWWLDHYEEFAAHLHRNCRLAYYEEDTCVVFDLGTPPRSWEPPVRASRSKPGPRETSGPPPTPTIALRLAGKLWSGLAAPAMADLVELERSATAPTNERIESAWQQARWHAVEGDDASVLACLHRIATMDDLASMRRRHLLLAVQANLRLGAVDRARLLIDIAVERQGYDTELCLLAANAAARSGGASADTAATRAREAEWLAHVNRAFALHGVAPLRKIDPEQPLAIHNITATPPAQAEPRQGPTVTVIMPVCNSAATIGYALASVRAQTWRDLEILVIDDASVDETCDVVSAVMANDDRVRLIRLGANGGAYVARNAGLAAATGAFATVHDADDWSHPQKLEEQITHLLTYGSAGAMSHLVRVSQDLGFNGPWRPRDHLLEENLSSLMLPTALLRTELGGWDPVRAGADAELKLRLEAKLGRAAIPRIHEGVPWTFALDGASSLTRRSSTHVRTHYFGLRQEYRRAYRRWHATAAAGHGYRIDPDPSAPRTFPAPPALLSHPPEPRPYDVLYVGDLSSGGPSVDRAAAAALAEAASGQRVALFHWPSYDLPTDAPFDERLASAIDERRVDVVVADQPVTARRLVVFDPRPCTRRLDRGPAASFERLTIIVRPGAGDAVDRRAVAAHLEAVFGSTGEWTSEVDDDGADRPTAAALPAVVPPRSRAGGPRPVASGRTGANPRYWEERKGMMYYKYIDSLVRTLAADARSLIDVGSKRTPLIEAFDWIPRRDTLDIVQPYSSEAVRGIKADFLSFVPEERYDVALCLQVLEHIPDAATFARHLFEVADLVLISVPFEWPAGATPHHVHDPVDRRKLASWTGRQPHYDVVVAEPLGKSRLIACFRPPDGTRRMRVVSEASHV